MKKQSVYTVYANGEKAAKAYFTTHTNDVFSEIEANYLNRCVGKSYYPKFNHAGRTITLIDKEISC